MTPADSSGVQAAGGAEVAVIREALEISGPPELVYTSALYAATEPARTALDRLAARIEELERELAQCQDAYQDLSNAR
jgi:hypothetical protein